MTFSGRVLAVVVCAGLLGLAFWDGGYGQAAFGWSALLGLWACALVALWPSDLRVGREPALMVGLVSCLVVWTALSAFWSFSRPATLLEVERSLMYLGWLGALLLVLRREWWEAVLLAVVSAATAVAVFALLEYFFWSSGVDVTQGRLLFRPVGYANALGGLVALPIPVLAATAAGATHVRFRRPAAALLVPVAVALYLTHSRAAWLGVVVGTLYWLVHSRPGAKLGSVGIAVALPVLSVCVVALLHLTSSGSEGRRLLSAVVVLVGAVAAALAPHRPIVDESVRLRRTVIGLGVVATAFAVGVTFAAGLGDRASFWRVGWTMFTGEPFGGSGAGSFAAKWLQLRAVDRLVLDAHNVYLETLAELGVIGLALLVALLGLPVVRGSRRAEPLVSAAVGSYLVFLVHAAFEWDWEMPVVTIAALTIGMAVVAGTGTARPIRVAAPVRVASASVAVVAVGFTLASLLGYSAVAAAERHFIAGDPVGASRPAARARRLLPWSSEPWQVTGDIRLREGDAARARAAYEEAVRRDPHDWQAWLRLSLASSGDAAADARRRAARLNPTAVTGP